MPVLGFGRSARRSQPNRALALNRSHFAYEHLIGAIPVIGEPELLTETAPGAAPSGIYPVYLGRGRGYGVTTAWTGWSYVVPNRFAGANQFTVLYLTHGMPTNTYSHYIGTFGSSGYRIGFGSANQLYLFVENQNGFGISPGVPDHLVPTACAFSVSGIGSTVALAGSVNGSYGTAATAVTGHTLGATLSMLPIWHDGGGGPSWFGSYGMAVFAKAFPEEELRTLTLRPWEMYAAAKAPRIYSLGGGAGAQTIIGAGNIASGEAFGASTMAAGAVSILGAGNIGTAEAFGAPTVSAGVTSIVGAGNIASAEAFGAATLTPGAVSITGAGNIASGETFGAAIVSAGGSFILAAGNIASGEAFGSATMAPGAVSITAAGNIASAQAFGTGLVASGGSYILAAGNIASGEAFGAPAMAVGVRTITGVGNIASGEVFGSAAMQTVRVLSASGIASAEAFGLAGLQAGVGVISGAGAIASAEAFGDLIARGGQTFILSAGGIASAEAFGPVPLIPQNWQPNDARALVVQGGDRVLEVAGGARILEVRP